MNPKIAVHCPPFPQVSKSGKGPATNMVSADELRVLFQLRPDTLSDTYDCCVGRGTAGPLLGEDGRPLPVFKEQARLDTGSFVPSCH